MQLLSLHPQRNHQRGFTLIELVVVVALVSLMLFISVPRLRKTLLTDSRNEVSAWLIFNVRALKERSIRENKEYRLHVSLTANRLWISHEGMTPEDHLQAETQSFELPNDMTIMDVEYPVIGKVAVGRTDIRFFKKGYSDKVWIHMQDDGEQTLSFLIEPFLFGVKLYDDYRGFEY